MRYYNQSLELESKANKNLRKYNNQSNSQTQDEMVNAEILREMLLEANDKN